MGEETKKEIKTKKDINIPSFVPLKNPAPEIAEFINDHKDDPLAIMGYMRMKTLDLVIEDTIYTSWHLFPELFIQSTTEIPISESKRQLYIQKAIDDVKERMKKRYAKLFE